MKAWILEKLKMLKTLFDAWKIYIYVAGLITAITGGVYVVTDEVEPEAQLEPVVVNRVDELKIIHVVPGYALKAHTHQIKPQPEPEVLKIDLEPMINRAVEAYARKHDPQGLGH
jgi:hypothetical protein